MIVHILLSFLILTCHAQVRRIRAMRIAQKAMQSARSSRTNSPIPISPESAVAPLHKRIVDTVIGTKGGDGTPEGNKTVNPLSRLKLLLVGNIRTSAYRSSPDALYSSCRS